MRVLLHIGTEKTGSTSIQTWLKVNAERLTKAGVYPSRVFMDFGARKIAMYASDFDLRDSSFGLFHIATSDDHERLRREVADDLREDLEQARARGCHTYVISSEYLSSYRVASDAAVERVYDLLAEHAEEVLVLCFLRPQVDVLVSALSTQARVSQIDPLVVHTPRTRPRVDYLGLYRRWIRVFPDAMRLIPYKRAPSVLSEFSRALDVDLKDYLQTQSKNTRVDYRAARINHNINGGDRVQNIKARYLRFFMQNLPCEKPLSISRFTAYIVHTKYILRNRQLAKLTGHQITTSDLTPDFGSYPWIGNVMRAVRPFDGTPMLRHAFTQFNAQLWFERARSRAAEAELAALRGDAQGAEAAARKALEFVDMVNEAPHGVRAADLNKLRQRLEELDVGKVDV